MEPIGYHGLALLFLAIWYWADWQRARSDGRELPLLEAPRRTAGIAQSAPVGPVRGTGNAPAMTQSRSQLWPGEGVGSARPCSRISSG